MATTQVYTAENFESTTPVQDAFTQHYDLDNPLAALQDYARNMHRHTQSQMESACRTSRRRTPGPVVPGIPAEASQSSDAASVTSQASVNGYTGRRSM